jgi:hypothetical protein
VSRTGYFDQRIPFESGKPLPAEVAVRLRPVLTGIYGRVIDYRGINVKRFVVHLRSTAGGTPDTDYQKSFNSDKGAFVVTDVPPGTYTLLIQSVQSLPTDDVQLFRLEGVELRKGFLFGELQAQFPKPPFAK